VKICEAHTEANLERFFQKGAIFLRSGAYVDVTIASTTTISTTPPNTDATTIHHVLQPLLLTLNVATRFEPSDLETSLDAVTRLQVFPLIVDVTIIDVSDVLQFVPSCVSRCFDPSFSSVVNCEGVSSMTTVSVLMHPLTVIDADKLVMVTLDALRLP